MERSLLIWNALKVESAVLANGLDVESGSKDHTKVWI